MTAPSRLARAAAAAAALAVTAAVAGPAAAHPFGTPPTALVSARDGALVIAWRSSPDDAIALGEHLRLLPPGSAEGFREAATQVAPPAADEAALDASAELRAYLVGHIRVLQDATPCPAEVAPITDFVGRGAVTIHRCPAPLGVVELEITMLHEIHEAYRTFAIDRTPGVEPGQSVHTVRNPRRMWDFSRAGTPAPAAAAGRPTGGLWPLLTVLALGGSGGLVALLRARGRALGQAPQ